MTDTMIWTFGFLAFVLLWHLVNTINEGRGRSRRQPDAAAELKRLRADLKEVKDGVAEIRTILQQVE